MNIIRDAFKIEWEHRNHLLSIDTTEGRVQRILHTLYKTFYTAFILPCNVILLWRYGLWRICARRVSSTSFSEYPEILFIINCNKDVLFFNTPAKFFNLLWPYHQNVIMGQICDELGYTRYDIADYGKMVAFRGSNKLKYALEGGTVSPEITRAICDL